jgi:D-specific alpha-keto acid dehydrogenase
VKNVGRGNAVGITVFGCEKDEAAVFDALAPRFGVRPTLTGEPVSARGAALARGDQCVSVGHKSGVSESSLRALREVGVRYISTRSAGIDHIDVKAAQRLGITVGNVAYSPAGVADYTLMLVLMAIRDAKLIVNGAARYDFRLGAARGRELRDLTVGVVGVGRIGAAVIERLRGFGCRVLACGRGDRDDSGDRGDGSGGGRSGGGDRSDGSGGGQGGGATRAPLGELLEKSDIITLHAPLNAETYHMIGREQMALMRRGAFLVNTGRGALVDTGELIKALESGRLGGAALDVLEGETGIFYFDRSQQPMDNQFLRELQKMPNVIITPHTAYYTGRALYDTVEKTILNCLDFERGAGLWAD